MPGFFDDVQPPNAGLFGPPPMNDRNRKIGSIGALIADFGARMSGNQAGFQDSFMEGDQKRQQMQAMQQQQQAQRLSIMPIVQQIGQRLGPQGAQAFMQYVQAGGNPAEFLKLAESGPKVAPPLVTKPGDIGRDPNDPTKVLFENAVPQEVKPPPTRTRNQGGVEVFEEYVDGKWTKVSDAPRWAPPAPEKPEKGPAAPAGYRWTPDGRQEFVPGGPADPKHRPQRPLTEDQGKVTALYTSATAANDILNKMEGELTSLTNTALSSVPGIGGKLVPDNYLKAEAAAKSFAQLYIFALSGQAAPEPEVQRMMSTIVPKPGDGKAVVEQKRKARQTALAAIKARMGAQPAEQPQQAGGGDIDSLVNKYLGGQ